MGKRAANGLGAMVNRLRRLRAALPASMFAAPPSAGATGIAWPEMLESRVLLSGTLDPVPVQWDGYTVQAIPNQYVVYTKSVTGFNKIVAKAGFTDVQALTNGNYYQFTTSLSTTGVKQLAAKFPKVMGTVQPNEVESDDSVTPSDAYFPQQYALQNTGQLESYDYNEDGIIESYENQYGTVGQDIDATQAWGITTGSSNVIVAVMDSGVDMTNPDLAPNIWTNPNPNGQAGFPDDVHGWNFVSDDNDTMDDFGHGTNVAGIIGAAGNNGIGIAGVDWNVSIMPVKVLDSTGEGTEADIIAGINYLTLLKSQGYNIVAFNGSFGGEGFPLDIVQSNALAQLGKAGVLAVVAAGNSGENLDQSFFQPAKFSVNLPNVITVAAVDNQGNLASFSNFGAGTVSIAAPGVNILSTAPTYAVTEPPTPLDPTQTNPAAVPYGFESGTSQATPQVTGVIALEAAANPAATPAELKAALLNGARFDPNLASINDLPAKDMTSGVVDAYTAVQDVLNYAVNTNTTRHGNWVGYYGSQGAYVVGDSTAFPSFVTGTFSGGTPIVLQDPSRNLAAPQQVTNPATRIAAYQATASTETINLDFTDGNAHQVALYIADIDRRARSEKVQVIDAASGLVLSSQNVSNFTGGQYLVYDLRGNVQITLTNLNGASNAVFSGIFFDAVPTSPTTFVSSDTSTSGANWRNTYGAAGDYIVGDDNTGTVPNYVANLSTVISGTTTPAPVKTFSTKTKSPVALNKNQDIYNNIASYWNAPGSFDVDLSFSDTLLHQVTLYAADYDHKGRSERIEVLDAGTGTLLSSQDLTNFTKGEFLTFNVSGSVIFRVINTGGPSAVLSGIFFDNPPGSNGSFQGTDATTQGNWVTAPFGEANDFVVGVNFPGVDDLGLTTPIVDSVTGASERILSDKTTDPRAPQNPDNVLQRVAGYLYTNTSMTFDINFGDNYQHELALYFVDYEKQHRSEFVTIQDANTGQILAKQRMFNFQNGKYLLFNVTGSIAITIQNAGYPNAVLSGIFTD